MSNINELYYRKTINTEPEFKITTKEFLKWLSDNHYTKTFFKEVKKIYNFDTNSLYSIAWDYSIPIIMVKYFRNK